MNSSRTRIVALLAAALVLLAVVGGVAFFGAVLEDRPASSETDAAPGDDRSDEPTTESTIGYVEGYWYDDELPVDDRDDATLAEDELEAVIYRSMARVEVIRELPFEEDVDVEVVSREEYLAEHGDVFGNVPEDELIQRNVNYEALFVVDRATDAEDEYDSLYGGAVNGYYDPTTEEVVIVSDNPDAPETDEIILGHELLHALQDQRFGLEEFDRSTIDEAAATNGLVEGDAVWVETEYETRCETEWNCVIPEDGPAGISDINWGLYLILFQPYDDGPDYVEYLQEQDDGWSAVDAAYDDPPASSSEVIRPGDEREPVDTDVEDRSSDEWEPLEIDGEVATETVGEVGMVSMFAAGAFDPSEPTVLERGDVVTDGGYEFDHRYTDGWAGDELVVYVAADAPETTDPMESVEYTGYVWQSEWQTAEDAEEFLEAYLELLSGYGAAAVDDRADTYEIDDDYPGAYAVDRDGETVTIVRGPSVDDLSEIERGSAPAGGESLELAESTDDGGENDAGAGAGDDSDAISAAVETGLGSIVTVAVVVIGTGVVIVVVRSRRTASPSETASSRGDR
ncbi:Hvo_1808 family surface protein [Natrarchaeobius sp. A-rgal3]|uniref:Hvo_1808 family surface protein n=1 Tax=Natrarchaeobius versutus TaxID=1679078 RepID=UPI00350EFA3B